MIYVIHYRRSYKWHVGTKNFLSKVAAEHSPEMIHHSRLAETIKIVGYKEVKINEVKKKTYKRKRSRKK